MTENVEKIVTFARAERNKPLGIFMNKDSCHFPLFTVVKLDLIIKITTPVRYSTICKWELRSQDGRVAQSVPNGLCPHVIGFYF